MKPFACSWCTVRPSLRHLQMVYVAAASLLDRVIADVDVVADGEHARLVQGAGRLVLSLGSQVGALAALPGPVCPPELVLEPDVDAVEVAPTEEPGVASARRTEFVGAVRHRTFALAHQGL